MLFMYNVFTFAALYIPFVKAQIGPVVVQVGSQGSFYSPPTVSLAENDSITFEFFGFVHSVTQSSFEDPCAPLPGGFHSGFFGMGMNNSGPVSSWNLVVTNVSAPIWYYCAVTNPSFHCSSGMVGAINPPSQAEYTSFSIAAKMITTTQTINSAPTLTGVGAFATSSPTVTSSVTPTPTPRTSSSSQSTASSTTATPTATTAPSTTNPDLGAIVGGTVGGCIALIAFAFLLWFFCMRNKQAAAAVQNDDFFRYNPVPAQRGNEIVFAETTGSGNFNYNPPTMSNTVTDASIPPTARLTPLRRPAEPVILEPPYLHRQTSQQSDLDSSISNPTTSGRNRSEPSNTGNVDIRALAQEVAAVLYQSPAKNYSPDPRGSLSVQNDDDVNTSHHHQQPPPNYRTVTGASSSVGSPGKASHS